MIEPTIIDALVAAGCTAEQLAAAVKADAALEAAKVEARKAKGRARFQRWKETHSNDDKRSRALAADSNALTGGDVRVEDNLLPSEIEQRKKEQKETRGRAFDTFWAVYPHRVGKAEASKAFDRALKRVDPEILMAGLQRYAAKTDDRPWCNPATWLNQDRWTDEPAAPVARAGPASQSAPSMSQLLTVIRDHPHEIEPGPPEDRSGFRAAIPHLRTVGAG